MPNSHAEELQTIADQARRLLEDLATPEQLKLLLERPGNFDHSLWAHAVEQGWPCVAIDEPAGGLGLGWVGLGVLCQEVGRVSASLPLIANTVVAHALSLHQQSGEGSPEGLLQFLISGERVACLGLGDPDDSGVVGLRSARVVAGNIDGETALCAFAAIADVAMVWALDEEGGGLFLVELGHPGVHRSLEPGFDNARAIARLAFEKVPVLKIGAEHEVREVSSLTALLTCFEQLGGAQRCLDMACQYSLERRAFGQAIGGFQGVKHKLAEIYCLLQIAQGCLSDAVAAWEQKLPTRYWLSSVARIAAIQAYSAAAEQNLHVHGGMGVTWEAMPHHFYRRSRALTLELGGVSYWRERLLSELGFDSIQTLAGATL
ncbi:MULTISPECIES: acyl-CoA dehydrogenase family protein [unclassified Pseudomonas]|uniref:acyl-CoA dehydrogenase family protein n=1 Tax=unclassified Pseudomonas TaxID=196821 RepID=UPI0025CC87D7|nr:MULTISPECIES: acyl-CoA dehydrogenase family protein [unclassified Pseudomonas]